VDIQKPKFLHNKKHVELRSEFRSWEQLNNELDQNYWSGSIFRRVFPKIFFDFTFTIKIITFGDMKFYYPAIIFDIAIGRHPAKEPYGISMGV
jgi:hypothetical protein